jgi:hypothetical protein
MTRTDEGMGSASEIQLATIGTAIGKQMETMPCSVHTTLSAL